MKTRTGWLLATAAGIGLAWPLLAAERMAVKTGLWESTETMQLSGLTIPAAQLDKVPAAQRAQVQEMLQKMGAAPRTIVHKLCITAKDLDGEAFAKSMQSDGQDCQYKMLASTTQRQEWNFECKSAQGSGSGHVVIEATSDTQAHGTMDGRMQGQSGGGAMSGKFEARWVAASCAGAEDK